jgi:plastocyanin
MKSIQKAVIDMATRPVMIFAAAVVILGLPAVVFAGAYEPDRPAAAIFRAVCASCHGYTAMGDAPGHDYTTFVDETGGFNISGKSVSVLTKFARGGRGLVMPGFNKEEISDTELNALATCINNGTCTGTNIYPDPPSDTTVWVQDEPPWFSPYVVNVATGATVKFVNRGQTWHTVTQGDFLLKASDTSGQTNSGLIGRGGKYFRTFATSGATNFYCMLHPFMQVQVCAAPTTCTAPTYNPVTPIAAPSAGVGELWVAAQFQDVNSNNYVCSGTKPCDFGAAKGVYPDLPANYDNFTKPGEIQVINLAALPTVSITKAPSAATNPFNNPHYIWGRASGGAPAGSPEMVIDNYFDNYKSFLNGSTKAVTLARLTWGTTASHTTAEYDGKPLKGPVQGDYGIQSLTPGSKVGSWSVGGLTRITSSDTSGHTGSMPHGIWAGGTDGTTYQTANSRSNNATVFKGNNQATCGRPPAPQPNPTYGGFPLNAGITTDGTKFSTTNVGNPTTFSTSITINLGVSGANCGTSTDHIQLPGEGAVQTPPSPDNAYLGVSNGPFISIVSLESPAFPVGSTCVGGTMTTSPSGRQMCSIDSNSFGAHGVAWGCRAGDATCGATGYRVYMAAKFTNFVAVFDVARTSPTSPVTITHVGDIPLPANTNTQTFPGLAGAGGQGITTRPLPPPWL